MNFKNCTIIVPVIRETDAFETVIQTILDTNDHKDLAEFIVVVHPQYTAKESFVSIEKMRKVSEEACVPYTLLYQKLPGMGGAMRDALDIAKGSHTIISNGDMALDPAQVVDLINLAKKYPEDVISCSRFIKGGKVEGYTRKWKYEWSRMSQRLCSFMFHTNVTEFTFAYRICLTKYYHDIIWKETTHAFALEGTLKLVKLGLTFHEIPGHHIGGSQSGFKETLSYFPTLMHVKFMSKKKMLKEYQTA